MLKIQEIVAEFDNKCLQLMNCTQYSFTRREAEILILSCYGMDINYIAKLMNRSPKTIRKHRENAKKKTQLNTLMKVATHIWPLISP